MEDPQHRSLLELQNFVTNLLEADIKFLCNQCLDKLGFELPPTWYYHDTGRCEECNTVNDVSVPALNSKVKELKLVIDEKLEYKGKIGRNVLWSDRIYHIKGERFNFGVFVYENNGPLNHK